MLVHRKAYTRADGTRVRATSFEITNRGKPGRGPKLFSLRKGGLREFGYSVKNSNEARHAALNRARATVPTGTLIKRLIAVATLSKRTMPVYSNRYRSNANWLR